MSATARNVAFDLSQKTTMLMRRNLFGIGYTNPTLQQNMNADASTSHGLNLINDLPTFVTINESLGMLKDKLSSVFAEAKVFGFVQYMCNIANETAMNLRDIFPRTPGDRDFTVITSAENAEASQAIAQQEVDEALAEQTLYAQQQGFENFNTNQAASNNGYVYADNQSVVTGAPEGNITPGDGTSKFVNGNLLVSGDGGAPNGDELGLGKTYNGSLKCDTDGATPGVFDDPTGSITNKTSIGMNGGPAVNANTVPYVVISPERKKALNLEYGDWALVTDNTTKNQVWGRVVDGGPSGASAGEISAAGVRQLGYSVTKKGNIVSKSDISVSVTYYPGSQKVAGNKQITTQYVAGTTTTGSIGG
jgi:hypothetical protein